MRWLLILLFLPSLLCAQSGASKRAWKNYEDGDYERAGELAIKSLQRDSLDAMAWFLRARLAFTPDWPPVDIDHADAFWHRAVNLLDSLPADDQSGYYEAGMTRDLIRALRQNIDSAAFTRAREAMTEEAFVEFLSGFPQARERDHAINYRDSLAFGSAVSLNTYQAYQTFMDTYPEATQVPEARARYEKLYFDIATEDGTLESYQQFLLDNPATPYRREAEFSIFSILTAANDLDGYLSFLEKYPKSQILPRLRNYLYHIYRDADSLDRFPTRLYTDSLRNISGLTGTWIPFLEEGLFGFMDQQGTVKVVPRFTEMNPDYLCEGLQSDVVLLPDGSIRNRQMDLILEHKGDEVSELPMGLLRIRQGNRISLYHKTGYKLLENFQDIRVTGKLIAVYDGSAWGLATLTGQVILKPAYQSISFENDLYFLENADGWQVLTSGEIFFLAGNKISNIISPVYDEYFFYDDERLWLRAGEMESLVTKQLEPVIEPARQTIRVLPSVYVINREEETRILRHDLMQRYSTGDEVLAINDRWLVLRKEGGMGLFSFANFRLEAQSDSVRLLGDNYAMTWFDGNRRLFTPDAEPQLLGSDARARLLQGDAREWILLEERRSRKVINRNGQIIYEGQVDNVTPLTDSLLVLERYGRKELLTLRGEKPLQVRFDGIGTPEDDLIPLLSGQRFGAYDLRYDRFVRPISTKKIRRYNENFYVAEMDQYGLIDQDSRMVVPFEFEQVRHWNDTASLVLRDGHWMFYHIGVRLLESTQIKSFQEVINTPDEHEIIVFREGAFGVLNSRYGEVIPATLDDILNIGRPDDPLYFTDKYVPEANLHVVVYFDRRGNILRKEAMEELAFEKVYCD